MLFWHSPPHPNEFLHQYITGDGYIITVQRQIIKRPARQSNWIRALKRIRAHTRPQSTVGDNVLSVALIRDHYPDLTQLRIHS